MQKVVTLSSQISFRDVGQPKDIEKVFTPLQAYLPGKAGNKVDIISAIESVMTQSKHNLVITGNPGGGKTTTMKYLCYNLLLNSEFLKSSVEFPILIRLREGEVANNPAIPIFECILSAFGIIIDLPHGAGEQSQESVNRLNRFKKLAALAILNERGILLVLDGLDEAPETLRKTILANINEISLSASRSRFVLTTRKGDDLFHLDNCQKLELAPLSLTQIEDLSSKWLSSKISTIFLSELKKSKVFDEATRPLILAHLCAIYENDGELPETPREIYHKSIDLLLTSWNRENNVKRESKFNNFGPLRKREFLSNLAFDLSFTFGKSQFFDGELRKSYRDLHRKFQLPAEDIFTVINEIEVHNGILTKPYDGVYEFAHRSFQEYLAAEYIVRLSKIPIHINLMGYPSEMALAVTLASDPTEYLVDFIDSFLLKRRCDLEFLKSFFTRLNLEKPFFNELLDLGRSILSLHDSYYHHAVVTNQVNELNEIFSLLLPFNNLRVAVNLSTDYLLVSQYLNAEDGTMTLTFEEKENGSGREDFVLTQHFYNTFIQADTKG